MELGREFDFRLNLLLLGFERHLCEHHAHLVLAWICSIVLVLHVGVYIAVEELLVVLVGKHESDPLVGCLASVSQVVIRFNNVF